VIPLLATIIPLGIAAAIRPSLFATQLLVVGQAAWGPRARALAVGAALPLLLFGVLVFAGFNQLPKLPIDQLNILGVSIRTVIGVLLLGASVWLLRSHPALEKKSADFLKAKVDDGTPRDFFILGLLLNGKSLTSYALLLPALHDIASVDEPLWEQAIGLALLYILAFCTLWIPMVLAVISGHRGGAELGRLSDFVIRRNFTILGVMTLIVGLYLTGSAALLVAVFERL
jgi:hypothetical protein